MEEMEEKEIIKKEYELSFLSKDEEGPKEVLQAIKSQGGEITFESPVSKIALAYPIEKETSAYFGHVFMTVSTTDVKGIDETLKMKPNILRFLLITPPFVKGKPRPALSSRPRPQKPTTEKANQPLSNEALEKKIEEILNK